MHATVTNSPFGACSFCSLRNLPKFCVMIGTACYVETDDAIETVIWQPNVKGIQSMLENGVPPHEMTDFFNNTDADKIKRIATKVARKAVAEKQR